MKKLVSCLLLVACIVTMSVGVMALPAADTQWELSEGTYTVTVDGLTTGNRYGLLAIKADAVLATVSDTDIMYIDQATAVNGTITFNGDGNGFLPKDPLALDAAGYKLYLGGADLSGATQIGVLAAPETTVTINKSTLTLPVEGTDTLSIVVDPANPEITVTWASDKPEFATVDETTGLVTAVAEGTAIITGTVSNGKTVTCTVTVSNGTPGDVDGSGYVDSNDAIYLLTHTFMSAQYPIKDGRDGDVDGSGYVDSNDAIYLLTHTFMSAQYPLYPSNTAN